MEANMTLSSRFEDALTYACTIHAGQNRKGTPIPYISHLLSVAAVDRPREVAVVGAAASRAPLTAVVWERFRPDVVLAQGEGGDDPVPLLAGRTAGDAALAYVCEDFVCALPVGEPGALRDQLE
jgi:uncharacterized protein YyaL (SSP411 family)